MFVIMTNFMYSKVSLFSNCWITLCLWMWLCTIYPVIILLIYEYIVFPSACCLQNYSRCFHAATIINSTCWNELLLLSVHTNIEMVITVKMIVLFLNLELWYMASSTSKLWGHTTCSEGLACALHPTRYICRMCKRCLQVSSPWNIEK